MRVATGRHQEKMRPALSRSPAAARTPQTGEGPLFVPTSGSADPPSLYTTQTTFSHAPGKAIPCGNSSECDSALFGPGEEKPLYLVKSSQILQQHF